MADYTNTPKAISRSRLIAHHSAGELQRQPEAYNHSSLALDPVVRIERKQPVSLQWPNDRARRAPSGPLFSSLDSFQYKRSKASNVLAILLHAGIAIAVVWIGMQVRVVTPVTPTVTHVDFKLYAPIPPKVLPVAPTQGGGGGGGAHQIVEPTRGRLPEVRKLPAVLAPQILRIDHPKLAVDPTMQVKMPDSTTMPNLGMPHSPQIALASQGMGSGSGFGSGIGGGIGAGRGSGVGPGSGGGYGGGLMSVGGGVSAPILVHSAEPEFTSEARAANFQGAVSIQLIVDSQGNPQNVHVTHHLGMGLDDKAIEAVRQYRFRPAMYQGHPVAVQMVIEVEFHLH